MLISSFNYSFIPSSFFITLLSATLYFILFSISLYFILFSIRTIMLLGIKSIERGYNYPIIKARVVLGLMLFTIATISSAIKTIINNITNLIICAIDLI